MFSLWHLDWRFLTSWPEVVSTLAALLEYCKWFTSKWNTFLERSDWLAFRYSPLQKSNFGIDADLSHHLLWVHPFLLRCMNVKKQDTMTQKNGLMTFTSFQGQLLFWYPSVFLGRTCQNLKWKSSQYPFFWIVVLTQWYTVTTAGN